MILIIIETIVGKHTYSNIKLKGRRQGNAISKYRYLGVHAFLRVYICLDCNCGPRAKGENFFINGVLKQNTHKKNEQ